MQFKPVRASSERNSTGPVDSITIETTGNHAGSDNGDLVPGDIHADPTSSIAAVADATSTTCDGACYVQVPSIENQARAAITSIATAPGVSRLTASTTNDASCNSQRFADNSQPETGSESCRERGGMKMKIPVGA